MDDVDNAVQCDADGEKRHATLRSTTASLTATTGRAPFEHHGVRAGKGVR
ncbi:DUF6380 family protein [Streptomyces sp. NRRL B-24085]|nr:DUF6380 family protein [Streptomyces sp. NRRL B-24085]